MGSTIGLGRIWSFVLGFRSLVARLAPFKRVGTKKANFLATESVNFSATMVRLEVWREKRKVRFFGKGKCELTAIVQIFGMGKCKLIANFSATMMTSLPSISLSLSLCISLSLSLSPSVHHAQYRKRFRASYNKWGLFIKMATDWQVSEVGDTCRAAAGPGRRRSVQIEWLSAGTAHLGFPALLSVPHFLSREIKMNRRHWRFWHFIISYRKLTFRRTHCRRTPSLKSSRGLQVMTSQNIATCGNGENCFWTKIASLTKARWEKSLSLIKVLYSFVEGSERFWQLFHSLVCHISKNIGNRTNINAGPFFDPSTISQHAFVWDAIFV